MEEDGKKVEEPRVVHRPDFVVMEENEKEGPEELFSKETFPPIPLRLRLLCFAIGTVAVLYTIGAFLVFLSSLLLCSLTLFQVEVMKQVSFEFWQSVRKGAVVSVSMLVSVFSPFIGFTTLFAYFLIGDAEGSQGMVSSWLRSTFRDYMR